MAYDERLAERVRGAMGKRKDVVEKKMFGGIAFMVRGHMSCGIVGSSLMVRIDPAREEKMLRERGAKPMDFTGRPMRGFLYVEPAGLARFDRVQEPQWHIAIDGFVDGPQGSGDGLPGSIESDDDGGRGRRYLTHQNSNCSSDRCP